VIVAAAIKHQRTGVVFSMSPPARHDTLIKALIARQPPEKEFARGVQGFVTDYGAFLDRERHCCMFTPVGSVPSAQ